MTDYKLHTETIEVPKGTGRNGFTHVVSELLSLDRIQSINIDARGKVTYTRYVRGESELPDIGPQISFEKLMPYACVRNGVILEVQVSLNHPAKAISKMFQRVSNERLYPIAFVTGANTTLWDWLRTSDGMEVDNHDEFFGLPVMADRHVDDYVLMLASAYGRQVNITEVQKTFKIIMPQRSP
jgi:hypothetical protein